MKHKETGMFFYNKSNCIIYVNFFSGQSRGFAFIEFATVEQAIQLKDLTQVCSIVGENSILNLWIK